MEDSVAAEVERAAAMVTLTVTIPDDLYERIEQASRESDAAVDETVVGALERAFTRQRTAEEVGAERQRIREALGDLVSDFDGEAWVRKLGLAPMSEEERQRIMREMPELTPPASMTVIQMRDEERY